MGNNSSNDQASGVHDQGALSASQQAKIRMMGALSHDFRVRHEEREHLRERLADLKAERRRISLDLRRDRTNTSQSRVVAVSASGVTRDTDKPAVAAFESDKICALCGKEAKREKNYPCRVCSRIFHPKCLQRCGECRPADLKAASLALTDDGWSCFYCSNLSSLLTEEEIDQLIKDFDEFDTDKDNVVSWEEYRNTRGRGGEPWGRDRRMSELEELALWIEFKMADQNSDNCLDWWEFLNMAAQRLLGKRKEVELVDLLSEKEVIRAKSLFISLDQDNDGVVTGVEARRAIRKWCHRLQTGRTPEEVARMSPQIDQHVEVRAQMLVDGDNQHRDMVTWPDFLAQQALYILCKRPNMALDIFDHFKDLEIHT